MDLVREILLQIEREHVSTSIYTLKINNYDMETIAYHCKIMCDAGLLLEYKSMYADNGLYGFRVGGLSWEGNDYLDKIRDNSIWKKTKDIIADKGLPLILETIKTISTAIITATAEDVATAILQNGYNS